MAEFGDSDFDLSASTAALSGSQVRSQEGDSREGERQGEPSTQQPSLLDRLKCPPKSDLCRKRKVQAIKPPTAAKKQHKPGAVNPTDPKTVTASSRVKEFPNEHLVVKNSKLFCGACREEIALKKKYYKKSP